MRVFFFQNVQNLMQISETEQKNRKKNFVSEKNGFEVIAVNSCNYEKNACLGSQFVRK